ncbi:MAG TPA: hypothetical protein VNR40_21720, partial [Steroidobacter sp.]|nr:hypothetical protein [Steroidobacter sp.]
TQSTLDLHPFGTASTIRSYGADRNRTAFRGNASLGISVGANSTLTVAYGGEVANDRSQHEINLGFRVMW